MACKFDIFNDEYVDELFKFVIVELPINEFIIFYNVVDVVFKLLIDNVELVDKLFKLLNMVVDVVLILLIDNVEFVDILFTLLNIVVEVALILLIDNVELVDKLFKLLKMVVEVVLKLLRFEFIVNTDKSDVVISPTTFNEEVMVLLLLFINILLTPLT